MKDWTQVFRSGSDLLLPVQVGESQVRLFIVDTRSGVDADFTRCRARGSPR